MLIEELNSHFAKPVLSYHGQLIIPEKIAELFKANQNESRNS